MCCCCPPAVSALFCLWAQSGCSKSSVAGALTFFPPDPPLYQFERRDSDGNILPHDDDGVNGKGPDNDMQSNGSNNLSQTESPDSNDNYDPTHRTGETKERMQSPAQQLVDRAKDLRQQAKLRNARDGKDHKNNVQYRLKLDSRLAVPRYDPNAVEAIKVPSKNGIHVAAVIYRINAAHDNGDSKDNTDKRKRSTTKTIIYSHGNATDIGAMFPLQAVLAHSLDCNVVMYDYSGFGESGGMPLEENTYCDIQAVYDYTLEHVANNDPSSIILYGQSVGGGPCCYLAMKNDSLGGMVLHSAFTSGMRVLTPSRLLACLDIYPNIDRIKKTKCPVMVIHGRLDEEVEVGHGVSLHQAVPEHLQREPWWVSDRGHNDITEGPGKLAEYIRRLRNFLMSLDD
ncbi:Protein ABHD17C [Seminavis robusta]|uniref:Protein ABHD17C n=1 Tax=Seminavis robusta TaxID=568900 RepID=A0A9N8DKN2_9STRA|nr:Protein ABHD17C [Seminavis robusta]|eukprot:Sro196_g083670.1 Protein ABHD17C (398) ;mRNA; r:84538-85820